MANNRELSQFGSFISVNDTNKKITIGSTITKVLTDELKVNGISTVGFLTATDINVSGVVTATTFKGNFVGVASLTDLNVTGITTVGFLTGSDAYFTGIVTATKFVVLETVGIDEINTNRLYVTGISSLGITTASSLEVTGITTLGEVKIYSGIITSATPSGIVTYYGDGSNLQSISASSIVGVVTSAEYAGYASTAGIATVAQGLSDNSNINTSGIITASGFAGNTGIFTSLTVTGVTTLGITTASSLQVTGVTTVGFLTGTDAYFSGIVTATTKFVGNLTGTATTATDVIGGIGSIRELSVSGVTTLGITTASSLQVTGVTTLGITSIGSLYVSGITTLGITTASSLEVTGITTLGSVTIYNSNNIGIITSSNPGVTTVFYYGDGTYLKNVPATYPGIASVAVRLETPRFFSITGDIVSTIVSFDGQQNVSLASTISDNAVGLGTKTYGDYVKNITGTDNEIEVSITSGEQASPQIGLPNDVTIGQDLEIGRNLNVIGNITVGGTSAYLNVATLLVEDRDIVLGVTTNSNGVDVSTDITANHGGIAIASTEGNPLISMRIAGISSLPDTYKQIMWLKKGAFAGLNTDAWISNYAIGIGSTQIANGVRLAVGKGITMSDDTITANYFYGDGSGLTGVPATYPGISSVATRLETARNFQITGDVVAGIVSFNGTADVSLSSTLSTSININTSGIITAYKFVGNIGVFTSLTVTGVTTLGITTASSLKVIGITTLGSVTIYNSGNNGIITSSTPGVTTVFYYGDGSNLTGISSFVGVATSADKLKIGRTITISGNQFSAIGTSFDGSANVAIGLALTTITGLDSGVYGSASKIPVIGVNQSGIITSISSIDVTSIGNVATATTATNVVGGIGSITNLSVTGISTFGDIWIKSKLYDYNNLPGTPGQVLQSTSSGVIWAAASGGSGGGGSGKFDTSIDNVLYSQLTGTLDIVGVGTTTSQITTLPSGASTYIIHSIHVANISNGDAEVTSGFVINGKTVSTTISVGGGPGSNTITVVSASNIVVGMIITGTGNTGETTGIGTTAGFQYNTYVTSVDGTIISLSKPLSGAVTGTVYFSPVSKVTSRLPVPVGSAVELLKQPFVLYSSDSIVLQSTGAGTGIGTVSTASISQTSGSNFLTVASSAAIVNFIASGNLIQGIGANSGIQNNTYIGVGYTPGSLIIPMTRPAKASIANTSFTFTDLVVPEDGALQATIVYQTSDSSYINGVGSVLTTPKAFYGTGNTYPGVVQSIRVTNVSDSGDYPVSVGIGNVDTIFTYLAYNMVIPKNSNIELCEAPKRLGIGQSIFAFSDTAGVIEIQISGKLKTS